MSTHKKHGQVGHRVGSLVAIAAIDFVNCSRILTGEIRASKRIVVIGGKVDETTAIVARQDNGEDMHIPLLSAIYVDLGSAADAFLTRSEEVYRYADDAHKRDEVDRSIELRKAAQRLLNQSIAYRSKAGK